MKKETLTPQEWTVMSALWGHEAQSLSQVIASMGSTVDWSYTTYASYLTKMVQKGFVGFHAKGRDKFYYPIKEKDECIEAEGRSLLSKLNRDSAKKLLICMIREGNLTKEDQADLKALIDDLSRESE
ncbi:MAG: BlaI/MecI/CopY family transcriptional regulator [Eubacteriales bacterium]